jgi:hypothetical protein
LPIEGEALAYMRRWQDRRIAVLLNLDEKAKTIRLDGGFGGRIEISTDPSRAGEHVAGEVTLGADEAVIIIPAGS